MVNRRGVLIGVAAGGGLVAAWALAPRRFADPLPTAPDEAAFGAWLRIARDGVVTVAVPQLEMGQGVTTLLPQIVAWELGADWRQVAMQPVPPSGAFANVPLAARWAPLWMPLALGLADDPDSAIAARFAEASRFTATAEGTALAAYEAPARAAAATVRALLVAEGAARWGVAQEECTVAGGLVRHARRQARFGDLAQDAAARRPPDPPLLRPDPPAEPRDIAGTATGAVTDWPRLDLPAKVDGSFLFAGDVRLPNMAYAAIRHAPIGDARLAGYDRAAIAGVPGVVAVVPGDRWLAAVAQDSWTAERALDRLAPRFAVRASVDGAAIAAALDTGVRQGAGLRVYERGSGDADFGRPDHAARYDIAPAAHATIETACAVARIDDGRLEVWIAAQAPERARAAAARAAGMAIGDTVLYPMAAGGSFDARLDHAHAAEAAAIARAARRPVLLTWSRAQEHVAGLPRAPAAVTMAARLAPDGTPNRWRGRYAMAPAAREFGERLFGGRDPQAAIIASSGAADALALAGALPAYAVADVAIDHIPVTTGLPAGRLRGNGDGLAAFGTESFVDELATRAGREPLGFRIEMLGGDVRLAACLQRAARLAGWGGGRDASGQGIACWRMGVDDTHSGAARIACVATAGRGPGGVRVASLTAAVDLGRIVNRDIARQQIEGGLIFGVGLALGSALSYANGWPVETRLAAFGLPTLADSPLIAVDFIASDAPPADPGEIGAVVAPPAIANALFSAAGLRLRTLPLIADAP